MKKKYIGNYIYKRIHISNKKTKSNIGAISPQSAYAMGVAMQMAVAPHNAKLQELSSQRKKLEDDYNADKSRNDMFSGNNQHFDRMMQDMNLNAIQRASIMSASNPAERANRLFALTRGSSIQGTFQGRSFNFSSGVDGAYHGSIDSSFNVQGGYNVNMGSAMAAGAYQAGGVEAMRVAGMGESGMNLVKNTVSNVSMFAPAGGLSKLGANIGVINPNSMYVQGVGKFKEAAREKKSIQTIPTDFGRGSNIPLP